MYIHLRRGRGLHSRSDASQSAELSKTPDEQARYIEMKMSKNANLKIKWPGVAEMLVIDQTHRAD